MDIDKQLWHTCQLCKKNIKSLAKIYGGANVYYSKVFEQHLMFGHDISLEEYFEKVTDRPTCECGICNQKCKIGGRTDFKWSRFVCGRYPGQQEWSEKAKESRKGAGNPMYQKAPWNKGLTAETSEILAKIAEKNTGRIFSPETRSKQSESAKKRTIHVHTGHKHSKETIEKLRVNTIEMHKNGIFKQTQTKPHIVFGDILNDLQIQYEEEKPVEYWLFDYWLIDYDVFVEVDGDYFHSNPKFYPDGPKFSVQKINACRDLKKNKYCKKNNMTLIRFWEFDILNNREIVKCELEKLLGLKK